MIVIRDFREVRRSWELFGKLRYDADKCVLTAVVRNKGHGEIGIRSFIPDVAVFRMLGHAALRLGADIALIRMGMAGSVARFTV